MAALVKLRAVDDVLLYAAFEFVQTVFYDLQKYIGLNSVTTPTARGQKQGTNLNMEKI